jgi:hypothetical protein
MIRLKEESVKKCFSLLREFIESAPDRGNQKRNVVLALDHLREITAGTDPVDPSGDGSQGEPEVLICGIITLILLGHQGNQSTKKHEEEDFL